MANVETDADIAGVAGVIFWTDNFDAMVSFYRDTLGLTPRSVKAAFANFAWGEFRLSIGRHAGVTGPARDPLRVMVNLSVNDIHAVHRRLAAAGVEFIRVPEPEEWGGWVATFHDPDWNTLQLMQIAGSRSSGSEQRTPVQR
jgi:catechol 2,3-dioxygenase-like lactoylglutathione lyase family enzyme